MQVIHKVLLLSVALAAALGGCGNTDADSDNGSDPPPVEARCEPAPTPVLMVGGVEADFARGYEVPCSDPEFGSTHMHGDPTFRNYPVSDGVAPIEIVSSATDHGWMVEVTWTGGEVTGPTDGRYVLVVPEEAGCYHVSALVSKGKVRVTMHSLIRIGGADVPCTTSDDVKVLPT